MSDANSVISDEWKSWAADALIAGAEVQQIVDALIEEGARTEQAEILVDAIRRSPLWPGLRRIRRGAARNAQLLKWERKRFVGFEVESRPGLSGTAFHAHYRAANRPVILPDLVRTSQAVVTWSFAWFAETFRGIPLTYRPTPTQTATARLPAEEYIARLQSDLNETYSAARCDVLRNPAFQCLFDDVPLPPDFISDKQHRQSTAMWLGPAGTNTPFHYDISDVLLAQIVGTKRVTLIPPCEVDVLEGAKNNVVNLSEQEVRSSGATQAEVMIGPGDTLFIPAGWLHQVLALKPSISLSVVGTGVGQLASRIKEEVIQSGADRLMSDSKQHSVAPWEHSAAGGQVRC